MNVSNPFDENYYFRQAALRICGDLHIERALQECLLFICNYIPADQMNLNFFDRKTRAILVFATATLQKALTPNMRIPIHSKDSWLIDDIDQLPKLAIENDPKPHSLAGRYLAAIGRSDASLISMLLRAGGKPVGVVQVLAKGKNRYKEEHSMQLSLLHEPFAIALSNSRLFMATVQLKDKLIDDNQYLNKELSQISGETIIGENGGLKNQIKLARQVAPLNSPVLILGETGTGKEVLARAIHNWSGRHGGHFIKVNCGAIPQSLMDSELFGHEKGAFTGASTMRRGRFERAHHGTILLDEVGELTAAAQVRLLRVIQEKEIDRVGGYQTIHIDVRIIATTHRNLEKMVDNGSFREDLYYRLNVFPIRLPPLRERKGDIEALLNYFMKKKSTDMGRSKLLSIPKGAQEMLRGYHWPGNVRELEHIVERALIISGEDTLSFENVLTSPPIIHSSKLTTSDENLNLDHTIAIHIRRVLERAHGRIEGPHGAAKLLGVKPGKLRYQLSRLGVPFGYKDKAPG